MADSQGADVLFKGVLSAGSLTVGILATAITNAVMGAIKGTTGQEKGVRDALAEENKRLIGENQRMSAERDAARAATDAVLAAREEVRKKLEQAWDENDDLRKDVQVLDRTSRHYQQGRDEARLRVNLLEQQLNLPQTQWPPDPAETISHD